MTTTIDHLRSARVVRPWVVVVIALVLLAGTFAVYGPGRERLAGPLAYESSVEQEHALPPDQIISVGFALPPNATSDVIELRAATVEGVEGLSIHGVAIYDPSGSETGIGSALGYPPADTVLTAVDRSVFPPTAEGAWTPEVVVGLSRDASAPIGRFDSISLDYEIRGEQYRLVIPFSVSITTP